MRMSVYNFVCLRCHGIFYAGIISQCHQQWLSKGGVGQIISIIISVITIWDKLLFKLRGYFYGLVISKKVLSFFSHSVNTHLDVAIEFIYVQSSLAFELCIDEEFIELWWADFRFESPHATILGWLPMLQWWSLIFSWYSICRILILWWILLFWWVFRNFNLIHYWHNHLSFSFFLLIRSPWIDSLLIIGWFFQAQNSGYPVTRLFPYVVYY